MNGTSDQNASSSSGNEPIAAMKSTFPTGAAFDRLSIRHANAWNNERCSIGSSVPHSIADRCSTRSSASARASSTSKISSARCSQSNTVRSHPSTHGMHAVTLSGTCSTDAHSKSAASCANDASGSARAPAGSDVA